MKNINKNKSLYNFLALPIPIPVWHTGDTSLIQNIQRFLLLFLTGTSARKRKSVMNKSRGTKQANMIIENSSIPLHDISQGLTKISLIQRQCLPSPQFILCTQTYYPVFVKI